MANANHSSNVPDFADLDPEMSVHLSGWESMPVSVPRTLVLEESLTPEEKMVGFFIHTVLDNRRYGGGFYDWLAEDDEVLAARCGLAADDFLTATRKLHDLGYIAIEGRPGPESPSSRDKKEHDLAEAGREYHRRRYVERMKRQELEEAARAKANARKPIGPAVRLAVYKADGYQCVVCKSNEDLAIDHIIPIAHGGTNARENLQTLCQPCNSSKGTKSMDEWMGGRE